MSESDKDGTSSTPQTTDTAGDHIEKKPQPAESLQQANDDESHG